VAQIPSHEPEPLRLDQFLKISGLVGTGGQAKIVIQAGEVTVNGTVELRRRRKMAIGDVVEFDGNRCIVESI
jgi:ribosome-associated protein